MNEFIRKTADQINSLQELYDTMCAWLLRPNASMCIIKHGCVYLRDDGNRCAVGALMPDGDSGITCDGDIGMLYDRHKDSAVAHMIDRLGNKAYDLCKMMQNIHDNDNSWYGQNMIDELNECAKIFGLEA